MCQSLSHDALNLPVGPRDQWFRSFSSFRLPAKRTPLGIAIIDAAMFALTVDRIRPHSPPSRIIHRNEPAVKTLFSLYVFGLWSQPFLRKSIPTAAQMHGLVATIRPELQNQNDYWLTDGFRSGRACVLPNEDGEQLSVMAAGNKSVR